VSATSSSAVASLFSSSLFKNKSKNNNKKNKKRKQGSDTTTTTPLVIDLIDDSSDDDDDKEDNIDEEIAKTKKRIRKLIRECNMNARSTTSIPTSHITASATSINGVIAAFEKQQQQYQNGSGGNSSGSNGIVYCYNELIEIINEAKCCRILKENEAEMMMISLLQYPDVTIPNVIKLRNQIIMNYTTKNELQRRKIAPLTSSSSSFPPLIDLVDSDSDNDNDDDRKMPAIVVVQQ